MGIESNWCSCTKCHAGYGWKDASFDFSQAEAIDCLICHDTTGTYAKNKNSCGIPNDSVDLAAVAKSVGTPQRENCGSCHWYGGGGDNVKHGDMCSTLEEPPRRHDIHMGGLNMTCQECHTTENHRVAGRSTTSSASEGKVSCRDCHSDAPHDQSSQVLHRLNTHGDAIACQTCHIPKYAKQSKTVTLWDWSQSGKADKRLKQNEKMTKMLSKKKGLLVKEKDLRPAYFWYNGTHQRYLKGDPVDLNGVTELNAPVGSIEDSGAKITPFKLMRGVEPADPKFGYLIVPKLFGEGYFKHFDLQKAAADGMEAAGLEYSGGIRFVETLMYWRINHEVAPKNEALSCLDCHHHDGVMDFKALGYKGDPAVVGGRDIDSP